MRVQESLADRAITFLFAVVFVAAAQGQAVGLRHCSLHDALPGTGVLTQQGGHSAIHASPGGTAPDPEALGDGHGHHHAAQEGQHSGAPGGCMDDCHVGTTTVAGPVALITAPSLHPASGPVEGPGDPAGPRHRSYELHLPNAPPLFG